MEKTYENELERSIISARKVPKNEISGKSSGDSLPSENEARTDHRRRRRYLNFEARKKDLRNGLLSKRFASKSFHLQESIPSFLPSFPNDISKEILLQKPKVNTATKKPLCRHKVVLRNVSLKYGRKLATFELRGRVGSMIKCLEKCCRRRWCNLAFKVAGYCYSVHCPTAEACKPVEVHDSGIISDYVLLDRPRDMNYSKFNTFI